MNKFDSNLIYFSFKFMHFIFSREEALNVFISQREDVMLSEKLWIFISYHRVVDIWILRMKGWNSLIVSLVPTIHIIATIKHG
jgi:hypothetical protein